MLWRVRAIALALVVVLAAVTVGRAARSWPRDAHLGYAEGIWLGLAVDASNGVLYRPLDGPQGIGGSRYFPLFYLARLEGRYWRNAEQCELCKAGVPVEDVVVPR